MCAGSSVRTFVAISTSPSVRNATTNNASHATLNTSRNERGRVRYGRARSTPSPRIDDAQREHGIEERLYRGTHPQHDAPQLVRKHEPSTHQQQDAECRSLEQRIGARIGESGAARTPKMPGVELEESNLSRNESAPWPGPAPRTPASRAPRPPERPQNRIATCIAACTARGSVRTPFRQQPADDRDDDQHGLQHIPIEREHVGTD